MEVHWKHRWMYIPYGNSYVVLYGDNRSVPEGSVVQVCSMEDMVNEKVVVKWPTEVQRLIEEFARVFVVPTELPPPRASDHSIPFVDGAAPVSIRPYRFAPALKDTIE
jgi:hypothetical protein